jgi:uncharacterized protein (TIGR03437 family)
MSTILTTSLFTIAAAGGLLMAQNVGVPIGLKAIAATKSQVQLSWSAGDPSTVTYTVERKTLNGSYALAVNATVLSATDTTIDAYQTYVYRVRANFGAAQSGPSNEVTVGPAPVGYNVVVPMTAVYGDNYDFGREQRMVLDGNGDPGIAYIIRDVNRDGDSSDSTLYFVRWDRVNYTWTKPVTAAVVGVASRSGAALSLSIAFDASTNTWGIAYEGVNRIGIAMSTNNGLAWQNQSALTDSDQNLSYPVLGMSGGKIHLAFSQGNNGIRYITGSATAAAGTWTSSLAPLLAGTFDQQGTLSLAIDSAGNPAIAYWLNPQTAYNSVLAYWRPGSPTAIKIMDTNGFQNDDPAVSLAFFGTQPRVVVVAGRDDQFFARYDRSIWASSSTNGTTWSTPVNLPNDGGNSMEAVISLAIGSQGQGALIMETNGGDGSPGQCSFPKISTSTNFASWTTCSPTTNGSTDFRASYPAIAYSGNDKLYFSATNYQEGGDVARGIVLWREPLQAGGATPAISTGGIVNAASFATTVAPGSLATIFGSNFAATAQSASEVPLPKSLGGVSVTLNGIAAPLVYAGANQINYQVPYEVQPGTANVVVTVNGQSSPASQVTVAAAAPGIFVFGQNRAVVQNDDYSVNESNNPAKVGSTVIAYATGQGLLDNAVPTGNAAPTTVLSRPRSAVTATIGGRAATVVFGGLAPGFVGLMQINLTIPSLTAGTYPLIVTVGGVNSNAAQMTVIP